MRFEIYDYESGRALRRVDIESEDERVVRIPEGVVEIKDNVFQYSDIDEVIFPESLREIGHGVFFKSKIKRVVIPKNLSNMASYSFMESNLETVKMLNRKLSETLFGKCTKLVKADLGESMIKIISSGAFVGCSSLQEVIFPKQLKRIDDNAFSGCNLSRIVLPETVERIKRNAFMDNGEIEELVLPRDVKIEKNAFAGNSIKKIVFREANGEIIRPGLFDIFGNDIKKIEVLSYPDDEEKVYEFCVSLLCELGRALIPDLKINEDKEAREIYYEYKTNMDCALSIIENCVSKRAIEYYLYHMPKEVPDLIVPYLTRRYAELCKLEEKMNSGEAFTSGYTSHVEEEEQIPLRPLKEQVRFTVSSISDEINLRRVDILDPSVKTVVIPKDYEITEIEKDVFAYADVEGVVLPNSLKVIHKDAFRYSKIKKIVIPENVKRIEMGAFSRSELEELVVESDKARMEMGSFSGCTKLKTVKLCKGAKVNVRAFGSTAVEKLILEEYNANQFEYSFFGMGLFGTFGPDLQGIEILHIPENEAARYEMSKNLLEEMKKYIAPGTHNFMGLPDGPEVSNTNVKLLISIIKNVVSEDAIKVFVENLSENFPDFPDEVLPYVLEKYKELCGEYPGGMGDEFGDI